jgi:uncharacterized protein YoxC
MGEIRQIEIPPLKSGDCSKDASITENHVQVISMLSQQVYYMVVGFNNHIATMENIFEKVNSNLDRVNGKLQDLSSDVADLKGEVKLANKDYKHLKEDVDRIGDKVRDLSRDVHNAEGSVLVHEKTVAEKKLEEVSALKRMFLSPLVSWLIVGVLGLALIGLVSNIGNIVKEQVNVSVTEALAKKGGVQ